MSSNKHLESLQFTKPIDDIVRQNLDKKSQNLFSLKPIFGGIWSFLMKGGGVWKSKWCLFKRVCLFDEICYLVPYFKSWDCTITTITHSQW